MVKSEKVGDYKLKIRSFSLVKSYQINQLTETKMAGAWLLVDKRHMKQLFTRPRTSDRNIQNTAAFNYLEGLSRYHAFWHLKVGSCVSYEYQIA